LTGVVAELDRIVADAVPIKLRGLLQCPRCATSLESLHCSNPRCVYAGGFLSVRGQPVLIDFDDSIFDRSDYEDGRGYAEGRRISDSVGARMQRLLYGENKVNQACSARFLNEVCAADTAGADVNRARPRVLVIGGGTIGSGAAALYADERIELIGSDVYVSPHTDLALDGHRLPFRDASLDGVWIQAVLEHVLEPARVAAEIHRVLKPAGVVFAGTPFMQQVHEAAYDFTRFTLSGHRWLFRRFSQIDAGTSAGAGTAAIWSVRYLLRALGWPRPLISAANLMLFPLRYADNTASRRLQADAASGVYFIGRKSEAPLGPKDMPAYYESQDAVRPTAAASPSNSR
jgi:SAM-dependent methyltransferase